ncbi:hypothetical protein ADUPG1_010780 [Aduncisulcus paluster]|uniref:Amino acid transporter transmembrane domain-containing protein n=1 Tax=Aduncisulcus paluster TaxID=2918883 RepID=A0ABQ5JV10_9EUKA|nr:hypothetical protein ADUPG1_010780 [Aduncisulcus paluster]
MTLFRAESAVIRSIVEIICVFTVLSALGLLLFFLICQLPSQILLDYFGNFCGAVCVMDIVLVNICTAIPSFFKLIERSSKSYLSRIAFNLIFFFSAMVLGALYVFLGEMGFRYVFQGNFSDESWMPVAIHECISFLLLGFDPVVFRGKFWDIFSINTPGFHRMVGTLTLATILTVIVYAGIRNDNIFSGLYTHFESYSIIFSYNQSFIVSQLFSLSIWGNLLSRIQERMTFSRQTLTFIIFIVFFILAGLMREGLLLIVTHYFPDASRPALLSHVHSIETDTWIPMLLMDGTLKKYFLNEKRLASKASQSIYSSSSTSSASISQSRELSLVIISDSESDDKLNVPPSFDKLEKLKKCDNDGNISVPQTSESYEITTTRLWAVTALLTGIVIVLLPLAYFFFHNVVYPLILGKVGFGEDTPNYQQPNYSWSFFTGTLFFNLYLFESMWNQN